MTARMRKKVQHRLMWSVMFGHARHVANALRSGADPNLPDRDRSTPLYRASVVGRPDVVRMLVRAGADPSAESGTGAEGLPLCAAACWGHTDTVRELLAAGADPNAREDHGEGYTASDWAAQGGWDETLAVLQAARRTADSSRGAVADYTPAVVDRELTVPLMHIWNRGDENTCGSPSPARCATVRQ